VSFLDDDRAVARVFLAVAAFGLAAAVFVGVVGLMVVDAVVDTGAKTLELTATVVDTLDDAVTVARDTTGQVSDALTTAASGSAEASLAFRQTADLLETSTVILTHDVPDAIDGVLDAVPALERTAAIIDGALRFLTVFGVDYDPDVPFDEAIASVAASMEGLPGELRSLEAPMLSLQASFESFAGLAVDVGADVRASQAALRSAETVYDSIEQATAEAATIVAETTDALDSQRTLASAAVVLAALALASLQIVPAALGARMLRADPPVLAYERNA